MEHQQEPKKLGEPQQQGRPGTQDVELMRRLQEQNQRSDDERQARYSNEEQQ